jgi:hypothetical protein
MLCVNLQQRRYSRPGAPSGLLACFLSPAVGRSVDAGFRGRGKARRALSPDTVINAPRRDAVHTGLLCYRQPCSLRVAPSACHGPGVVCGQGARHAWTVLALPAHTAAC